MATQPDDEIDDTLELDGLVEPEEDGDHENPDDEGEPSLVFGDEPEEPESTPPWVKHLRQEHARLVNENRELRQQQAIRQADEAPVIVGDKPTMESCDYDVDEYERQRDAYDERKSAADKQQRAREAAQNKQNEEWGKVQQRYAQGKAALTIPGADEAEQIALAELSNQQQAVIARHADNPALFIVALGKNPAKLAQISSIEDPFALTKAMTKMEATLKQTKGPRPPEPERRVTGKAISASGADKTLEKLEKEADRTGDRTKVIEYKRAMRAQEK